ncbi:MAG: LamG-like jellyroll fold domain-containing protein [Candidatus Micrarchaeaceae archaeon]|jgi:hypothetical protein
MLGKRAQVSIDLLVSYGIAILVITIALYTVLQLGVFNSRLAPEYCNATPSFSCDGVALTDNGVLTIIFSQTTGGVMSITGAACSGTQNSINGGPAFGNVNVLPESTAPSYYPANQLQSAIVAYSGSGTRVTVYCYSGSGVAKGNIGNSFTGTVWINYTLTELPNTLHTVQQLATFTEKYASSAVQPTTTSTSITTTSSTSTSTSTTSSIVPTYPGSFSAEFIHENAITINTAKVPASQLAFPVLISGTYPFLANTANGGDVQSGINGYDIVFANDIYGYNALYWQVESYNGATGAANIWVNTPVSSTASTVIYMFYGNSIINSFQSNPAMVWNGNYLGVYHFSSNAGALSAADSTSHGATGTITGTTATSSGIIDGAGAYTGDGTFIVIPSASINTALESPAWSVSEWFYMNSGGQGQVFGAVPYWSIVGLGLGNNVGSCGTAFWVVMDEEQCVTSTTAPSTGAWHYMTLTYNNLNSNLNVLYMDGTPVASTSFNWYGAAPSQPSMVYATSGNTASFGQGISGNIDELEISNAALSANWIQTEYNNQYSPSTFYSISYIS